MGDESDQMCLVHLVRHQRVYESFARVVWVLNKVAQTPVSISKGCEPFCKCIVCRPFPEVLGFYITGMRVSTNLIGLHGTVAISVDVSHLRVSPHDSVQDPTAQ
jgi:hypothetical protein